MKTILFAILLLANTCLAQSSKVVQAHPYYQLVTLSGAKAPIYYDLAKKEKTTLQLVGPGELTIYTRTSLANKNSKGHQYYLKYYLDDQLLQTQGIKGKGPSQKHQYRSKKRSGYLSKAAKTKIQIPPGKHEITFFKHKTKRPVHARFLYQKGTPPDWREISSLKRLEQVRIAHFESKKAQAYQRVQANAGFVFVPKQNTRLRVFLRIDFDYSMLEESTLRVLLKENGQTIATYKVSSQKSSKVENNTNQHLIAGQLEKIYIDSAKIKKGRKYELVLKDQASAIIRVFVDQTPEKIQL